MDPIIDPDTYAEEELPPGVPVDITEEALARMTVPELKAQLGSRSVYFPSKLKKQELRDLLMDSLELPVVLVVKAPGKKGKLKNVGKEGRAEEEKELAWDQHHPARKLLIDEIAAGRIPVDAEEMGPAEVHYNYIGTLEFQVKGMECDDKFTSRLRGLRVLVKKDQSRAKMDTRALRKAMKSHPVAPLNHRGQPQWNGSVAQALLQCDMSLGKHKTMAQSELRLERIEYQVAASIDQFRWKIRQESRTQKYLYTLECEADEKLKKNLAKCHRKK